MLQILFYKNSFEPWLQMQLDLVCIGEVRHKTNGRPESREFSLSLYQYERSRFISRDIGKRRDPGHAEPSPWIRPLHTGFSSCPLTSPLTISAQWWMIEESCSSVSTVCPSAPPTTFPSGPYGALSGPSHVPSPHSEEHVTRVVIQRNVLIPLGIRPSSNEDGA